MSADPAKGRHRFLVGLGMAAGWKRAVVPVWDFAAPYWRPYVQRTVADFNFTLHQIVPRIATSY